MADVSGGLITAVAPGRVNLIGDHTDTTGGWCMPMAISLGTTVSGHRVGDHVILHSAQEPEPAIVPIDVSDPAAFEPAWARYVAGVVAETRPKVGFRGTVQSTIPTGAGLSSSAALEVAVALALGHDGDATDLAHMCQRAEHLATGVPCGIMDQLTVTRGIDGHALLIDCTSTEIRPVGIPPDVEVVAVHSGEARRLEESPYGQRRAEVDAAATLLGPLRDARVDDLDSIKDVVVRRRARHVITENARVNAFAEAIERSDLSAAGALMVESHASLRDDFDVSTPALDELVERLRRSPGVYGARLTGAGFGGCVVALAEPAVIAPGPDSWPLRPVQGARRLPSNAVPSPSS